MDEDVSKSGSPPPILDAEELAKAIRQLAIEAHRTLNSPDATAGELIALRRRFKELLHQLEARQAGISRWLRRADRALEARLLSNLRTERGSLAI
jgi:hypothetical protein